MSLQLTDFLPDCSICYESLRENLMTSTACGHVFHSTCLEKWMSNNSICPICRRVIKNKIKILFDFKSSAEKECSDTGSSEMRNSLLQETTKANLKLIREMQMIQEEKTQLEEKFTDLNEQVIFFASQFAEVNQTVKDYKNKIIDLNYRLEESEKEVNRQKEIVDEKEKKIQELQNQNKELESKIEAGKDVVELLARVDEYSAKDISLRETVLEFMKKADGARSLTTFIYVLHQKIKNYEEEIDGLKKKNVIVKRETMVDRLNDKAFLSVINNTGSSSKTMNNAAYNTSNLGSIKSMTTNISTGLINSIPSQAKKRKFTEFSTNCMEENYDQNKSTNISSSPFKPDSLDKISLGNELNHNKPGTNLLSANPFTKNINSGLVNSVNISNPINKQKIQPFSPFPGAVLKNSFLKK